MFLKYIASPINAGALAMVAGLIVVPVVSVLTPKMNKDTINSIFACYDETVTVHTRKSIEE
jgi:SSS family solute:Na+ symporter